MKRHNTILCCLLSLPVLLTINACNNGSGTNGKNDSVASQEKIAKAATPCDSTISFGIETHGKRILEDGGVQIERSTADSLIGTFRVENGSLWYPLKSPETGEPLKGFTINRKVLEDLLGQTGSDGIRIYIGKDPSAEKRKYTMVLVATTPDGQTARGKDLQTKFYEHVDPCPTHCASNDDYESKYKQRKHQ